MVACRPVSLLVVPDSQKLGYTVCVAHEDFPIMTIDLYTKARPSLDQSMTKYCGENRSPYFDVTF